MAKAWWSYKKHAVARRMHAAAHDARAERGATLGARVSDAEHQASVQELEDFARAALKLAKHNQKAGDGPSALGRVQDIVTELVRRLHVADSQIYALNSQVHNIPQENTDIEEILDEKGITWHSEDGDSHAGPEWLDEA